MFQTEHPKLFLQDGPGQHGRRIFEPRFQQILRHVCEVFEHLSVNACSIAAQVAITDVFFNGTKNIQRCVQTVCLRRYLLPEGGGVGVIWAKRVVQKVRTLNLPRLIWAEVSVRHGGKGWVQLGSLQNLFPLFDPVVKAINDLLSDRVRRCTHDPANAPRLECQLLPLRDAVALPVGTSQPERASGIAPARRLVALQW